MTWNYYQYRKAHDYPVYLRFQSDEASAKLVHLLVEMGFNSLSDVEAKKISLQRSHTKVLTVQPASARLQMQIMGSDSLDQYGLEALSLQGGVPVYTYRRVGMMSLPASKTLWDLAYQSDLSHTEQLVGLRIVLVRFLAQALSELGVLSYWGAVRDESIYIMKQAQSFGEAVFIDHAKKMVFSNGYEMKLSGSLKVVRKDKEHAIAGKIGREELISFLSVSTCLLSFSGITYPMRTAIYELSAHCTATVTPCNVSGPHIS